MEGIKIEWYGPYKTDTVVEEFNEDEDFGIYMITRRWGKQFSEKILYIGITYRRYFAQRLYEHQDWLSEIIGTVKVRVGYLREKKRSLKRLKDAESLLIYVYQPEYNTLGKSTYSGRDFLVINSGRRGPLDMVVDSSDYEEW